MNDARKPEESGPPPAIEPDPGLDQLLSLMGTAIPPQAAEGSGYFENLSTRADDRINAHVTRNALGSAFPSTVDMRVAGVLVPKRRTPGWVYAVGSIGGLVAVGLLGAIAYLLLSQPGGMLSDEPARASGEEYSAARGASTAAATTAEPATVAMIVTAAATAEPESAPASAGSDEIAYADDDETKKVMDGMTGKAKAGSGAAGKKAAAKTAKGPGDDAPDLLATSAPGVMVAKGKVTDPSKAGTFDDDLTKLLEKKKAEAATATPEAAPVDTGRKLGADDVKRVLGTAKGRIALCGKIEETDITVSFEINLDGSLGKISPKAPHASSAVGACVTGILKGLKFPEHDGPPQKVTQSWKLIGAAED